MVEILEIISALAILHIVNDLTCVINHVTITILDLVYGYFT